MPISAALGGQASEEALDFLDKLSVDVKADTSEQLALWAKQEFADAASRAKTVVVDKAISLVRAVREAVDSGEIPAEWDRSDRLQELVTTGLKQYDPRVAFQASLRSSYSAGRYQQGMEDEEAEEFWLYRSMGDSRVRSSHQALNGVYLPKSHKFWDTHFTPNGWRCRCKVVGMNQRNIDRLKASKVRLQSTPPDEKLVTYRDKVTGKETQLPESIEPGWDFNPGGSEGSKRLAEMVNRRMALLESLAN